MRLLRYSDSPRSVFIVFLLIYLLTLTSNFTGPHDSMAYLNMLGSDHGLWHPHHLLYHVLSKYWLQFWKLIFPGVADYYLVESFSSVWGAATLSMVFIFFRRRFGLPTLTAWLGTAVAGFSYGIWFYSVNVEVYMPSLFFTVWSLYILSINEWTSKQVWRIGAVHSLAVLFHQMNILLAPIVIYKIVSQRKNIYVFKSIFWYGMMGLIFVGGMYFIGGWIKEGHNNFESWMGWVRGYTGSGEYWQPLSWKTPAFAGLGFLRTFVGGQFLFQVGQLSEAMDNFLKVHALQDEIFLVRNLSAASIRTILILCVLLMALMFMLLFHFIGRFREKMRSWKHVIIPLLLYMVIYSAYFFFWMPEILEFWLGQCIICWLLLIGTYRPVGKRLNIIAGTIAVLLMVINYTGSIKPMRDISNDIGYARIEKVKAAATENDLVIIQDPWLLKEFLEYYTKAHVEVIPKESGQQAALFIKIKHALAAGHRVYVFPANEAGRFPESNNFIPALREEYGVRMSVMQQDISVVYVIK
ncbi:MAG TPA: hypothetical protein VD993_18740 [Chitinophagaceae bacterium]|nr:hypothetical protein [Chitinophagaceae bacterium]